MVWTPSATWHYAKSMGGFHRITYSFKGLTDYPNESI